MATRRAITAGLALLCVLLFTAFAAEGPGGPLHSLQRGVGGVMAPFQGITAKAVKPLRDGWSWLRDVSDARERAARFEKENQQLRTQISEGQFRQQQAAALNQLKGIDGWIRNAGDDWRRDYAQRPAMIINASPSPWYDRADLNVGTADGVVVGSPVLASGDLVDAVLAGVITRASSHYSTVTFITEGSMAVGVSLLPSRTGGGAGVFGLAQPTVAGEMEVTGIPRRAQVETNDFAYTAGRGSGTGLQSLYPAGIPVGWVNGAGAEETDAEWTVQLTPFVRPSSLTYVVVLAPRTARARERAAYP